MMKRIFKYLAIVALFLALTVSYAPAVHALGTDFYAPNSKLATGQWVKISVGESGIYQITAAEVRNWGLGSDLSQIHVFGYGGAPLGERMNGNYADDLPQVPVVRTADRILFYGQGPLTWKADRTFQQLQVQHPYAMAGIYFVTNDSRFEDVEIDKAFNQPAGDVVTTYTERLYHEQDLVNPGETGRNFLGESFMTNKTQTFKFDLEGLVPGSDVSIYSVFAAKTTGATSTVAKIVNSQELTVEGDDLVSSVTDETHEHYRTSTTIKTVKLEGTTDLNFTIRYSCSGNVSLARLDFITVNYQRQLALRSGSLAFGLNNADASTSYRLSGCGATTRVWDVTTPFNPLQLNTVGGEGTMTFSPASSGRREFIAFDESGSYASPVFVGSVDNQDIHGMSTPDMIILAPSAYLEQARRVADLHEKTDGFSVIVLDHEKVFNEFSSGTVDAMAYRRLCKMFFDRGTSAEGHKLGYLLLMGGGSYYNKLIDTNGNKPVGTNVQALDYPSLLTWQSEMSMNESGSYSTDDLYGILADGTSTGANDKMDIAVGRMPVKSVSEARTVVNKLVKYVTKPDYGSWKNQALIVADDENNGDHMIQSDWLISHARKHGGDNINFNRVFIDAFSFVSQGGARNYPDARAKMFNALHEGTLWWNYIGHASTQNWTAEGLLMRSDVETRLFYRHLPVLYAATCEFARFDNSTLSSGEHMFLNPNGGVIALICPVRLALITDNGYLSATMGDYIFSPDEKGRPRRIGDIFRLALNNTNATSYNNRRFYVLGDPAMRLAYAPYNVQVETINGQHVDSENMPVFKAREQVEFSGKIVDWNGQLATNFDGAIVSTLFGPEQSVVTNGEGDGIKYTYDDRPNRLAINIDTVIGGQFTVRVIIPSEVNNEYDNYRPSLINLYAYDSRDTLEAKGANSDFYIYGYEDELVADTIGPDIIRMGLNDVNFVDGSDVNESPLLLATVKDESGVNFSSAGIGHSMTLTLDGSTSFSDLVSFYTPQFATTGTLGDISYQLNDLNPGPHTLRLRVWDVYNNVNEKTINFNVINGLAPEIVDVYCAANPASVETSFYVKHNRPDAVLNVTIEVYDLMGRMVWSSTQSGRSDMYTTTPVTWDLTDTSGRRVPRGIYVYRATISSDGVKEATKAKKLAVTGE